MLGIAVNESVASRCSLQLFLLSVLVFFVGCGWDAISRVWAFFFRYNEEGTRRPIDSERIFALGKDNK